MIVRLVAGGVLFVLFSACSANKRGGLSQEEEFLKRSHNSRSSLDWAGTYRGAMPCSDCVSTFTEISLSRDFRYQITTQEVGKESKVRRDGGKFIWDNTGNKIKLKKSGSPENNLQFRVTETGLIYMPEVLDASDTLDVETIRLYKTEYDKRITEKYWKLVELNGKKVPKQKLRNKEPHFILKTLNSRILGDGGCNSFSGNYELLEGSRIRFGKIMSTMMSCDNMESESRFKEVLQQADNYVVRSDTLWLNKARMAPLARFEAVYFR